jgi:RNA-directed DNA polymerase
VITRYFGKFNTARDDRWVFCDRASGAYLHRFARTNIVRRQIVPGRSSPDDPALREYWVARRRGIPLPVNRTHQGLYRAQDGRCHACHWTFPAITDCLQTPTDWERWLVVTRSAITMITVPVTGSAGTAEPRLIHTDCANRSHQHPPGHQQGLLEPARLSDCLGERLRRDDGERELRDRSGRVRPTSPRATAST